MANIGLIGKNSISFVRQLLTIWNNGDCAVLIDARIPLNTAVKMLKLANASVCYLDKALGNAPKDSIQWIHYEADEANFDFIPQELYEQFTPRYTEDDAIVIFSSGTTGDAKGILLSHRAINCNADAIADYMKLTKLDRLCSVKSFTHSSTITGELLLALKTKTPLLLAPTMALPRKLFRELERNGITRIFLNPALLALYTDAQEAMNFSFSHLKTLYVSGSILNDRLYEKAHIAFPTLSIYNLYGASEAGPRICVQSEKTKEQNSVGLPIRDVQVCICKEDGMIASVGEAGVLHVKTPSRFTAYLSGQERPSLLGGFWINTGDLAYQDIYGEYHILGRSDDLIFSDAYKVYPAEIEAQILRIQGIDACKVVGYETGARMCVACVYESPQGIDATTIRRELTSKLPSYEVPEILLYLSKIPTNLNGKYDVKQIKLMIDQHLSQHAPLLRPMNETSIE
ncbi:MAG: long-chain fatty acid--CoA ligase [Clostridia bacterium]|nr:long-chain fatty acid--CoA ligase [Clostridia bacterium]